MIPRYNDALLGDTIEDWQDRVIGKSWTACSTRPDSTDTSKPPGARSSALTSPVNTRLDS